MLKPRIISRSNCSKKRRISIRRYVYSNLFSRNRNQKRFLVSTFQTPLDLQPAWIKTVLHFLSGQRSGSVLSRLGPSLQKRSPGTPSRESFDCPSNRR